MHIVCLFSPLSLRRCRRCCCLCCCFCCRCCLDGDNSNEHERTRCAVCPGHLGKSFPPRAVAGSPLGQGGKGGVAPLTALRSLVAGGPSYALLGGGPSNLWAATQERPSVTPGEGTVVRLAGRGTQEPLGWLPMRPLDIVLAPSPFYFSPRPFFLCIHNAMPLALCTPSPTHARAARHPLQSVYCFLS